MKPAALPAEGRMTDTTPPRPQGGSGSGFWDHSLKLYADPEVASICLDLQDRFGLDVNLLLFCLYAGHRGRTLSADDLRRLDEVVRPWRAQVIQPLRLVRNWIRSTTSDAAADLVRRPVLDAELAAEHRQQRLMEETLAIAPGPTDHEASAANLARYAEILNRQPAGPLEAALSTLCQRSTEALDRADGAAATRDQALHHGLVASAQQPASSA